MVVGARARILCRRGCWRRRMLHLNLASFASACVWAFGQLQTWGALRIFYLFGRREQEEASGRVAFCDFGPLASGT